MTKRFFILSILILSLSQLSLAKDIIVWNTEDSGKGSLREAIQLANNNPGTDHIKFNIPMSDRGFLPASVTGEQGWAFFIRLEHALPEITDSLVMDGFSQTQFTGDTNDAVAGETMGAEIIIFYGKGVKNTLPAEQLTASVENSSSSQALWSAQIDVQHATAKSKQIFKAIGGRCPMR